MTKILITGATGFVGSNLARTLLHQDKEISILIRKESNLWRIQDILSELDVHQIDMGNVEDINETIKKIKPEIVFHLATYGGYPFQQDVRSTIINNILYGVNLMQSLETCDKLKRFINIGSSSEYGSKSKPMKEADIAEPITPYGIAKLAQTLYASYFFKSHLLPTVTLRLFSVYGPYEEPGRLIYDIMTALIRKQPLNLSSSSPRRDFIFIDDVISALLKAAEMPNVEGEIFNVGNGVDYSVKDVVDIASDVTNTKLEIKWGSEEKRRSFDTNSSWIADIRKSDQLLKWKPGISFKEGLFKTYQWYTNNIHCYEKRG